MPPAHGSWRHPPTEPWVTGPGVAPTGYHQPFGDLRAVWRYHAPRPPAPNVVPLSPSDQNTWGVLAHVSFLVLGFLGPLIVLLGWGDRSEWVRANAREALNFALTSIIAVTAGYLLSLVLIGIPLLLAAIVLMWVLPIVAAVKASRGDFYHYSVAIPFFRH